MPVILSSSDLDQSIIRLGVVGVDSSHLPEFAKRINALNAAGQSRCRVTAFHDPGDHQMPAAEVAKWRNDSLAMGLTEFTALDPMLDQVDGVLILAVSGQAHLKLALPVLSRGITAYIDKPLTCDLDQAKRLLAMSRDQSARCYSASSLRFATEIARLDRGRLGKLEIISAFGPGELNPAMEGLFFYGVHTIELVDAIWGPGIAAVRATHSSERDLVDLHYTDGRFAQLRMERKGCYDFGATVHGSKSVESFKVDFSDVYNRLIQAMVQFFEGGLAPVSLRDIVENVAVMDAGNRSMAAGGKWVDIEALL